MPTANVVSAANRLHTLTVSKTAFSRCCIASCRACSRNYVDAILLVPTWLEPPVCLQQPASHTLITPTSYRGHHGDIFVVFFSRCRRLLPYSPHTGVWDQRGQGQHQAALFGTGRDGKPSRVASGTSHPIPRKHVCGRAVRRKYI